MYRKVALFLVFALLFGSVMIAGCTNEKGPAAGPTPAGTTSVPATTQPVAKQKYIIGVDGTYPPYSFVDKNGNYDGFDVESARWIANKMGFDVEFQAIAWDGIIPALNAGKIDMVYSGMTITPERAEVVNFSTPYFKINQSFAVRNDSALTMGDILAGNAVFGEQRGTTGAMWVENSLIDTRKMPKEKLKQYDNFPLAVTDLLNKNVDVIIYDRPSLVAAIEGQPVKMIGEVDTNEVYGIAFRKSDVALMEMMNQGLDLLHKDPYYQELLKKYQLG